MPKPRRGLPLVAAVVLALSTASCAGNNSNPVPTNPPGVTCSVGTSVQLFHPTPGSRGNPTTIGSVQIVVDASTDLLGGNWNTILVDQFGNKTQGGTLTLTRSSGGPYPTNYYYNSSVPTLTRGSSYSVYINQFTSQCTPAGVGTFGT